MAHTSDRKAGRGAASRERILEVAIQLFAHQGYAATGVSAISAAAGIAPTAIYWHFGSKEGLLGASLERAATLWTETIYKRATEPSALLDRLDQLIEGVREIIERQGDELALLLVSSLQERLFGNEVRAALRRIDDRAQAYLVRGLEEALGRRVPDLDLAAQTALAHIHEIAWRHRRDPDPHELTRMLGHCKQMIAAAVTHCAQRLDPAGKLTGEENR